jgi:GrpB-like predicted nucleotidyltransferase (UPF0157 family)
MADSILVVPYDQTWKLEFLQIGEQLREALGTVALRIDHIGSTAIEGLAAKPVIDIQISVQALEPMATYRTGLEKLGYVWREDNPDLTKRYFRELPGTRRTHIHVRQSGSWSEQFALLFRDYVRVDQAAARRYEQVKYELAGLLEQDRHGYTEAKTPVIWEILFKASEWSQVVGWQPGPSDA